MANLRIKEIAADRLSIIMVDRLKADCGENTANAGFFAPYPDCTLPVGHLICDYGADDPDTFNRCEERGVFQEYKFYFDNSKWSFDNPLYGTAISTLVIKGGKASIVDTVALPDADYAISGIPVVRNSADCKWGAYVSKQGWVTSNVRPTWHTFVGVKDDPGKVYLMGMKTTTDNMVKSSEAFNAFKALGFRDVIKVDGGGSFYFDADGKRTETSENRRINTIFKFADNANTEGSVFKLALGAGHGKDTPGKRCMAALDPNETREWVLNDRICDKIEERLTAYEGYQLLRLDDSDQGEDISLADRVGAANRWEADFYLSVHHNAGINGGSGGGIVAYAHTDADAESLAWRDELYKSLIAHTGLVGNRSTPKNVANHYVTRKSNMPAVLLELGFMDSATDVPIILSEEYANQCAAAIVEVIVKRGKLTKKAADGPDSWAASAWEQAVKAGALDGTRPRDGVTRQELAVILDKLDLLD